MHLLSLFCTLCCLTALVAAPGRLRSLVHKLILCSDHLAKLCGTYSVGGLLRDLCLLLVRALLQGVGSRLCPPGSNEPIFPALLSSTLPSALRSTLVRNGFWTGIATLAAALRDGSRGWCGRRRALPVDSLGLCGRARLHPCPVSVSVWKSQAAGRGRGAGLPGAGELTGWLSALTSCQPHCAWPEAPPSRRAIRLSGWGGPEVASWSWPAQS